MTSHVAIWPRPHPEQIERLHTKGSHVHEQINWTGCLREIFAFHIEVKFSLNGRLHVLSCPCLMPLQRIWTSKSWHFSGQLKVMRRLQARLPKLRSSSLHNSSLPDESPPPTPVTQQQPPSHLGSVPKVVSETSVWCIIKLNRTRRGGFHRQTQWNEHGTES